MAPKVASEEEGLIDSKGNKMEKGMEVDQKQVGKAIMPECVAFLVEIFFCILITLWQYNNSALGTAAEVKSGVDASNAMYFYVWGTFAFFIIARIILVLCWRKDACGAPPCIWAGLFMFCSSFQFILYMAYYYADTDAWTYRAVAKTTIMDTWTGSAVADAYGAHSTYNWACLPYAPGPACDASTQVGVKACCTIVTYKLATPAVQVLFEWEMSSAYPTIKWLSFLSMAFIWKDIPFIVKTAADTDFLGNVWLDLLDAVTLGYYYVNSPDVLNHKYGIDPTSFRLTKEEAFHFNLVFWTWFTCFALALISPTLYIVLGYCDLGDKAAKRNLQDVQTDLFNAAALLDDDKAKQMVKEAVEFQKKAYKAPEGEGDTKQKCDVVIDKDAEGKAVWDEDGEIDDNTRPGHAVPHEKDGEKEAGFYDVEYEDGDDEDRVHVSRIIPDFTPERNPMKSGTFCTNWCRCSYLTHSDADCYERFANLFDHMRTVFLLDIPFGYIRYTYHHPGVNIFMNFMMLKNIVWGIINVFLLFSCGNEKATCCGWSGLETVVRMVKGSKLGSPALVMPGGLARLASDVVTVEAKSNLEENLAHHKLHKAWLILQMDKFDVDGEQSFNSNQNVYKEQIDWVSGEIGKCNEEIGDVHL